MRLGITALGVEDPVTETVDQENIDHVADRVQEVEDVIDPDLEIITGKKIGNGMRWKESVNVKDYHH